MSQEKLEIVRRTMDAYNARDLSTYLAVISESIRFRSRFSAVDRVIYRGHAGIRRYFAELNEVWSGYEMQLERMTPAGDQVAARCHRYAVGRDSDVQLEEYPGVVFSLEAGTIVQMDSYPTHAETLAAMGCRGSAMQFSINIPNFGDFAEALRWWRRWLRPLKPPAGGRCSFGITSSMTGSSRAASAIPGCC